MEVILSRKEVKSRMSGHKPHSKGTKASVHRIRKMRPDPERIIEVQHNASSVMRHIISSLPLQSVQDFEKQLQAILNVLPAYAWYLAPAGALTFVNTRTEDYFGLPNDHPLRLGVDIGAPWDNWAPLLHPDDREETRKIRSHALHTGEGGESIYRALGAHGDYRWFTSRTEPLRSSDGTILWWAGVTVDIHELKCTEQALRESEAKFRDYAETASDWFWEIGPDYKFTVLTENAFRSDPAARIGTKCWDHALDLETEPDKWRIVWAALDSREPFRDFVY